MEGYGDSAFILFFSALGCAPSLLVNSSKDNSLTEQFLVLLGLNPDLAQDPYYTPPHY